MIFHRSLKLLKVFKMKKTIHASLMILAFSLISSTSFANKDDSFAVVAPGWTFHTPNTHNDIFSSRSAIFKGTLAKRGDNLISALIVLKQPRPDKIKSKKDLNQWLNLTFLNGAAETLYTTPIKGAEDEGQLYIFKQDNNGLLRITFAYVFMKNNNLIVLSQESTPETYKEDMEYTVRALKNIKFIE